MNIRERHIHQHSTHKQIRKKKSLWHEKALSIQKQTFSWLLLLNLLWKYLFKFASSAPLSQFNVNAWGCNVIQMISINCKYFLRDITTYWDSSWEFSSTQHFHLIVLNWWKKFLLWMENWIESLPRSSFTNIFLPLQTDDVFKD